MQKTHGVNRLSIRYFHQTTKLFLLFSVFVLQFYPIIYHEHKTQNNMANGKDIDWQPIAYCAGALIIGLVVGTLLVAPSMKKLQEKKAKIKEIKKA